MRTILISLIITVSFGMSSLAQNSLKLDSGKLKNEVDSYIRSYTKTGDFSGCVAIKKGRTLLYQNCFGKANIAFNVNNTSETKFKIGSISKQFTAAAILILEEKGLLKTTDTLTKFYPEVTHLNATTIHHLLTHQSGIMDIYDVQGFSSMNCNNSGSEVLVQSILKADLRFKSGESYSYSNGGYLVLADIIEKLSQVNYGEFIEKEIFKPLKMYSSGHRMDFEITETLSQGYEPSGYQEFENTIQLSNELFKGSGSIHSTLGDLLIWIETLKNRSFLSLNSYEKLFNNYGNAYGYGISIYKMSDRPVFGHDGRISGFIADYLHYINEDISVLVLGNVQTGISDFFRRDLASIIFGMDYKTKAKTLPAAEDYPDPIKAYVGSYAFGPNLTVHIENFDGVLKARANEGSYSELVPLVDKSLFSRVLYARIKFVKNDQGIMEKMIWINNDGNQFEGIRKVL